MNDRGPTSLGSSQGRGAASFKKSLVGNRSSALFPQVTFIVQLLQCMIAPLPVKSTNTKDKAQCSCLVRLLCINSEVVQSYLQNSCLIRQYGGVGVQNEIISLVLVLLNLSSIHDQHISYNHQTHLCVHPLKHLIL